MKIIHNSDADRVLWDACSKPGHISKHDIEHVHPHAQCKCLTLVKAFRLVPEARVPERATDGSVGYDLFAAAKAEVDYGRVTMVRTGLVIQPPEGYFMSIRARSSLGKRLVAIPHSVGTIDPDYAGRDDELLVALTLLAPGSVFFDIPGPPVLIQAGDRIAQLLFERIYTPTIIEVDSPPLDKTRGGFGHTGR